MTSRKRPSECTIAFAISIVRSKPPELSVREHIQRLRQHVATGRRENALSSVYRHLDRSTFWKSEHDRLQAKLKGLECENAELKRQIESNKDDNDEIEDSQPWNPVRKRKNAGEGVTRNTRSSTKKQKTVAAGKEFGIGVMNAQDELWLPHLGDTGRDFLRAVLQLRKTLNHSCGVDAAALGFHITTLASSIISVMWKAFELQSSTNDTEMDHFRRSLHASLRAYSLALQALKHRESIGKEPGQMGHPIYSLVQIFSELLTLLQNVATNSTVDKTAAVRSVATSKTTKARTKQAKLPQAREDSTLSLLTQFMCSMVSMLDSNNESHKSVFEGFSYTILDSIGSSLYKIIFGHARAATLEAEIAMNPDDGARGKTASSEVAAARLMAPYLIQLLKQVMKAAPAHFGAETSIKASSSRTKQAGTAKSPAKGSLTIVAKERLQRTLVKCCFGTEGMDESDPFFDVLSMPPLPKTSLARPKAKEADIDDRFKEELWGVLGWDILAREDM